MTRPSRIADGLLFATVFTVTFAKLQWEVAGTLSLSDVLTALFLVAFAATRLAHRDGRLARGALVALGFFCLFLLVYLAGFFALDTGQALAQWAKGMVKFLLHFLFLVAAVATLARRSERFYWAALGTFCGGLVVQRALRRRPARARRDDGCQPRPVAALAADRRRQLDQRLRRDRGSERLPAERAHRRPEPPRHRAGDPAAPADAALPPPGERPPAAAAARRGAGVPAARRAGDALAQRPARPRRGAPRARAAVPAEAPRGTLPRAARGRGRRRRCRHPHAARLLRARAALARGHGGSCDVHALRRLRLHPRRAARAPALRARPEQLLRLLRVRHRAGRTSGRTRSTSRSSSRRGSSARSLFAGFVGYLFRRLGRHAADRAGARGGAATRSRRACARSPGG